MADKKNLGFGGQWVEIFAAGKHTDAEGRRHSIDRPYLQAIVDNFNPNLHEPPVVIGHPKSDEPAYGSTAALRVNGDKLEAQFADVDAEFERLVKEGRFKKRSAAFYVDPETAPGRRAPSLRHVGFLGAQAPAVKGLRNIQFIEGPSVTFEFSEDNSMADKAGEDPKEVANSIWEHLKSLLPGKKDDPTAAATFGEAEVRRLVTEGVTAATTTFQEELKKRDTEIAALKGQASSQSMASIHAANAAFVESLGKAKCPPAFTRMGIVEFMDRLATIPADQKVVVIEFSEEGGKKVETKTETPPLDWFQSYLKSLPPFISFGEQFGTIKAGEGAAALVNPNVVQGMRTAMGVKTEGATNGKQ